MKRFFAVIWIVVLVFALSACGAYPPDSNTLAAVAEKHVGGYVLESVFYETKDQNWFNSGRTSTAKFVVCNSKGEIEITLVTSRPYSGPGINMSETETILVKNASCVFPKPKQ